MNNALLVLNVVLLAGVLGLAFLVLGALRALGVLTWRLEQMEAIRPSRIGREGLKTGRPAPDFMLPCASGGERSLSEFAGRKVLLVLVEEQPKRVYESAESTFYVLEGQGGAQVGGLMSKIGPGSFLAVPRGTPFTLARQVNRPLSLLWTLSG